MFEIIKSAGWLIWPIIFCSVLATAIICERFWTLRRNKILPPDLVPKIWTLAREKKLDDISLRRLKISSPLGAILAAGLVNQRYGREIMKESIEDAGRHVAHELEKYLNTLGTLATVSPLLGLLGTVSGMIETFSATVQYGVGDPAHLGGGISVALINTAAGLVVAIPSLTFHRYFLGLVDTYVLNMEEEAMKLIEMLQGQRGEM